MIATLTLIAALGAPTKGTLDVDRAAIAQIVLQRHGASAHLERIIIHGGYALAAGRTSTGPVRDGLHLTHGGWRIVCSFRSAPTAEQLGTNCGFPAGIATEVVMNESAQAAVQQGNFTTALSEEKRAFASASGPDRDQERARVQLLHQLGEGMRTGTMTRAQAIRKWNEFRFSWMLP